MHYIGQVRPIDLHTLLLSFENDLVLANILASRAARVCGPIPPGSIEVATSPYDQRLVLQRVDKVPDYHSVVS